MSGRPRPALSRVPSRPGCFINRALLVLISKEPEHMKTHPATRVLILLAAIALAPPLDLAGDAAKVVGTWDAVAVTPDGDMPALLTIAEKEGALEAEINIGGMKRRIENEKLEGNVFTMTVIYDGAPYDVKLTVDGDSMEGTYSGADASGALTAKRRP
jgi:hypothetical protein